MTDSRLGLLIGDASYFLPPVVCWIVLADLLTASFRLLPRAGGSGTGLAFKTMQKDKTLILTFDKDSLIDMIHLEVLPHIFRNNFQSFSFAHICAHFTIGKTTWQHCDCAWPHCL